MDNARVEEGVVLNTVTTATPTHAGSKKQLLHKIIYFAATVLVLFLFVLLTRLLLPGDSEAQSAVLKALTQQVAAFLPIHEKPSSSTTAPFDGVNGTATTTTA